MLAGSLLWGGVAALLHVLIFVAAATIFSKKDFSTAIGRYQKLTDSSLKEYNYKARDIFRHNSKVSALIYIPAVLAAGLKVILPGFFPTAVMALISIARASVDCLGGAALGGIIYAALPRGKRWWIFQASVLPHGIPECLETFLTAGHIMWLIVTPAPAFGDLWLLRSLVFFAVGRMLLLAAAHIEANITPIILEQTLNQRGGA
jgi:hypothetical protein